MRRLRTIVGLLVAIGCLALAAGPVGAGTHLPPRIETWGHGSWSWFGDPRAVYVAAQYDETFVGWLDWTGHVTIAAYDPNFGLIRKHIVGHLFHDDHSAPSLFVEPDGRLTVFWSGHNGQEMDYRTTLRPEDVSSWGPVGHIKSWIPGRLGFTYPNPVMLGDEGDTLYLFWRGRDYSQDYATRTLSGKWSRARRLIWQPGQRPYVKYASNNENTIAIAFTNGHPRETLTSVYFAEYRDGWLLHASGRRIQRLNSGAIAPHQGDLVYDGRARRVAAWVWDVALDSDGTPVIVYATFPRRPDSEYWYARWTGQRWVSHFLAFAGPTISPHSIEYEYSPGITLDHHDPSILYLSRRAPSGGYEIQRWTTSDGGYRWHVRTVVPADGLDNVRPVVPRNGGPVQLMWLRGAYRTYTTYRTSIAMLTAR